MLADAMPGLAARSIGWLHAHGALPNKRAALVFLRQLAALEAPAPTQDDVTRYTS